MYLSLEDSISLSDGEFSNLVLQPESAESSEIPPKITP